MVESLKINNLEEPLSNQSVAKAFQKGNSHSVLKTPHLLDTVFQTEVKQAMRVALKLSLEDFIYEGNTDLEHSGLVDRIKECE